MNAHLGRLERLRALCPTVSVATLTADLMDLGSELAAIERAGVGLAHIDVMDGCFCPLLTVGSPYIKGLRTPLLKDVHLMIREPLDRLPDYVAAGADILTVQLEAAVHIHRVLQRMGQLTGPDDAAGPLVRGLALNPGTPVQLLAPLLEEVEMVVLLAVDPGWGGQKFIPETFSRVSQVRDMICAAGKDILICVDGGITRANVGEVAAAGADLIVTGGAVFDGTDATANAEAMLAAVREGAKAAGREARTPAPGSVPEGEA